MDERGRAAAVQVHRHAAAELAHHAGELEHRQPGVGPAAAAVADEHDQVLLGDPDRGARVAAVGDVGVELRGPGGEALAIGAVERDLAVRDEQRAGLEQVALRPLGQRAARRDLEPAVGRVQRRAQVAVGADERRPRDVLAGAPDVAQRPERVAQVEAADDRLADVVLVAPVVQAARPGGRRARRR